MLNIKHILLARDASPSAEAALPFALTLAERTGAQLHVVFAEVLHGASFDPEGSPASAEKVMRTQTEQALEAHGSDASAIDIAYAVVRGMAAAPALLDYAEDHDIDLIVMGTHGRRGVRRFLMGSVAQEIVRLSACPVLTVHQSERQEYFDSILVPIDFSEHARKALQHARALGNLLGARLDLLHVVEDNIHPAFYGPTVQSIYDIDPDLDEKALAHLKTFYEQTEGPDTEVTFAIRTGHPVHEIVQFAEDADCGLLVMGTHGLTGLERFFLGSVTEKVVRRASCPVFTIQSFGTSLVSSQPTSSTSSEASVASAEG
ncbi:MAG TPA: universal stress protein [Rhodothermales bacterium]|nr:universal stress protein [Rhodothermales bacterium]